MHRISRRFALALTVALALPVAAAAQTQKPPAKPATSTAKPSTAKPSTAKPATAKPPAAEPAKPPAPPPPQDVRFKSTYTNGDLKTESVTYIKGERERFEFQDMILDISVRGVAREWILLQQIPPLGDVRLRSQEPDLLSPYGGAHIGFQSLRRWIPYEQVCEQASPYSSQKL
jgi:hypothetical protein